MSGPEPRPKLEPARRHRLKRELKLKLKHRRGYSINSNPNSHNSSPLLVRTDMSSLDLSLVTAPSRRPLLVSALNERGGKRWRKSTARMSAPRGG